MAYLLDMRAHKESLDVLLIFDKDVGLAIRGAFAEDGDEEGVCLVKTARTVRREMLNMNSIRFDESFEEGCQEAAIPKSLLAFVGMILDGPKNHMTICMVKKYMAESLYMYSTEQSGL